jgi:AbrB family looped-hinge helix DNA binding protein
MAVNIAESQMARVVRDLAADTKSAKIRALAKAGYSRSEIANFVGCRYQFVRNVLVDEARKAERERADTVDVAAAGGNPGTMKVKVDNDGRVAIPPSAREALGLKAGDALIVSVADGELHLLTIPAAVRKAQAIVQKFVPDDVSLVDELLEDRRREVENEQRE